MTARLVSLVWTPVGDVGALHRELTAKPYSRLRPGVDQAMPGGPAVEVTDPLSNVIRFYQVDSASVSWAGRPRISTSTIMAKRCS
ncbi:glyoxalase superfamily protein [Nonomuraea sp. NPDC055795]